jgi:hypothetical protein
MEKNTGFQKKTSGDAYTNGIGQAVHLIIRRSGSPEAEPILPVAKSAKGTQLFGNEPASTNR